ncbi:hypothetical protein [Streptomyces sp. NBC_01477]|uniref:hypothetical protein n=1 Tax=Streptomyces sp. NBC_01477 TaxID=2976015 RepID=UPI002E2F76A7|nr:hypothetical protein [Streptomyces sp. NBC_01477]
MSRTHTKTRTGVHALVGAALVIGGLLAGAGQAQAATTVHCGDVLINSGFYNCDPFTDTGGPYTFNADTWRQWNPLVGGSYVAGHNVRATCESVTPTSGGMYIGNNCTPLAPQ